MKKAIFANLQEAIDVLGRTNRTWTQIKVKGGYQARMLFPTGWRYVEEIDVFHILANNMYRVAA